VEMMIYRPGNKELPVRCDLTATLGQPGTLPRALARNLYNLLRCCEVGVSLQLDPDQEAEEIDVIGVETTFCVEGLTAGGLADVLSRLAGSHRLVEDLLLRGQGDDHWERGS
jgi:hypothetical protein